MGVLVCNNDAPRHAQGVHASARRHDRPALNHPSSVSLKQRRQPQAGADSFEENPLFFRKKLAPRSAFGFV